MSTNLFTPFKIGSVTLPNRIVISPMSQYAAENGYANDWHFAHISRFALGGAGLIFTEATAVEARGRRTHGDLGLWEDGQIEKLKSIANFIEQHGTVPGIQLAHAGRKASERRPWHGESPVNEEDEKERDEVPWQAIAPSSQPYAEAWPTPHAMSITDIDDVIMNFAKAAARALSAGFKVIDIYAGHGFLLHQFCSPLSNHRTDNFGGCFDNRIRMALEVVAAIRQQWPRDLPLFFRLSATDWIDGGWDIKDTVKLSRQLKAIGVDVIDCSSGGIGGPDKPMRMPLAQGFQIPFAEAVKQEANVATMGVGFIWDARQANDYICQGKCDLVALAREALNNPNWPLHAARELELDPDYSKWPKEFGWWLNRRERVIKKLKLRNQKQEPK